MTIKRVKNIIPSGKCGNSQTISTTLPCGRLIYGKSQNFLLKKDLVLGNFQKISQNIFPKFFKKRLTFWKICGIIN